MYKVLNTFKEASHNNHVYDAGKTYPADGFDVDPKRVKFLQTTHRDYKVKFLAEADEKKDSNDDGPTLKELKEEAKKLKIESYSTLNKDDLTKAIEKVNKKTGEK